MFTKHRCIIMLLSIVAAFIYAAGCDNQLPIIPEEGYPSIPDQWTDEAVDDVISMEQVAIYSPAPDENGAPPAECNYIRFLRFKQKDMDSDPAEADAVLVMIPGVVEGANGFEYIGRMLPYVAKTEYGLNVEVWAFDRRNNCLEDTTGIDEAVKQIDMGEAERIFTDYYYNFKPLKGRTFKGFLKSKDMPFVSEFGLKMDTEDIYTIITTMIPDPEVRRKKVFVGGHSLGGTHTSMFAGWDFDGNPATTDDAGYRNCAGLFAFDSTVVPTTAVVGTMSESAYESTVQMLRNNTIPRVVPILDGEVGALMEAVGFMADMAPNEENIAIKRIPYSSNVEMLNGLFHSRTMSRFITGADDLRNYHYTNEALLGVLFDDDFAPMAMIQTSLGFLGGGTVVEKDFPLPGNLDELGLSWISDTLGTLFGSSQLFIATEKGDSAPLYHWVNYDRIGTADDPVYQSEDGSVTYTTTKDEVADIQDFARALYKGPSNLIEWYFSIRRLVDVMGAAGSYGPKYGLNFMHADKLAGLPQIEFPAGDGMFGSENAIIPSAYPPLPGYNHMDPMFASLNKPGNNKVIRPLIEFVRDNLSE